jgi:hypothetical protein
MTDISHRTRRFAAALLLAVVLLPGCRVERAHETEECIDRLMAEEGLDGPEAHAECAERQRQEAAEPEGGATP